MTPCPSPELFARYLGRQLTSADEREFLDHVARCERCRLEFDKHLAQRPNGSPGDAHQGALETLAAITLRGQGQSGTRTPREMRSGTTGLDWSGPPPVVGQYGLLRELGRGGMGVVYLARQESLGREVALKVLTPGPMSDPSDRLRFRAEAEMAAALHHPNIVQVFEVGEEDGLAYIAMEYVQGGTLADRIGGKPRDPNESARLLAPLAAAVQHAHEHGVIHRDLKPANILLAGEARATDADATPKELATSTDSRSRASGTRKSAVRHPPPVIPKVSDFGLARRLDRAQRLTVSGTTLGTPGYMAPEQAMGRDGQISAATDVYALGAILYEMLTGRAPFVGPTPLATMEQVCSKEPVPPRRLQPKVPRDLETICLKSLQKEPHKRYASAGELADDVHRFLDGEPITARPTPLWEHVWKWAKRRPAVASLAAGIVAVALAGFLLVTREWLRADREWERAEREAASARNALGEAERGRLLAEEAEASLAFSQGLSLCEHDEVGRGLLWLARSLERAERAGATHLDRAIRVNLAAWAEHLPRALRTFQHGAIVRAVAFSPDGRLLASAGHDGRVCFWEPATGEALAALDHPPNYPLFGNRTLRDLAWSPDGRLVATGHSDGKTRIWDVAKRTLLWPPFEFGGAEAWKVDFGPGGETLYVMCGDGRLRRLDVKTGQVVGEPFAHLGADNRYFTFALSQDKRVAVTSGADGIVRRWDVATGKPLPGAQKLPTLVECLAVRSGGEAILIGTRTGTLHVWDVAADRLIDLPHQGAAVVTIALSPDQRQFATGTRGGQVRLWDAETLREVGQLYRSDAAVHSVAFHPEGDRLAVAEESGSISIWAVPRSSAAGPEIHPEVGEIHTIAFDKDGRLLVAGIQAARLLNPADGAADGPLMRLEAISCSAALLPDRGTVALVGWAGHLALFDAKTGASRFRAERPTYRVPATALSADGMRWFTASEKDEANILRRNGPYLWDLTHEAPKARPLLAGLNASVRQAAFAPDGHRLLLACTDRTARFWDVDADRQVGPVLQHAAAVGSVAFGPDGALVLTGSRDGIARLWDATTGEPRGEPLRHRGEVNSVAFSPNGQLVLTGSDDGTARFWDSPSGRELGPPLRHAEGVAAVAFSADGRYAATGAKNMVVQRWQVPPRPVEGSSDSLRLWVETLTGLTLDEQGAVRRLGADELQQRRKRYEELGGKQRDE
jgi:WD40 repeat protein/serine/threonine protein kinase